MANLFPKEIEAVARIVITYIKQGFPAISTNWAINKFYRDSSNSQQRSKADNEKVAGKLCESGKYIKGAYSEGDGYWITKNPDKVGYLKKYPFLEKLMLLIIGATLSLIASLYLSRSAKQSQHLIDKRQDSLLKDVSDSQKSLQKHLKISPQ